MLLLVPERREHADPAPELRGGRERDPPAPLGIANARDLATPPEQAAHAQQVDRLGPRIVRDPHELCAWITALLEPVRVDGTRRRIVDRREELGFVHGALSVTLPS